MDGAVMTRRRSLLIVLAALVLIAAARHLTRKAAEHLLEEWSA